MNHPFHFQLWITQRASMSQWLPRFSPLGLVSSFLLNASRFFFSCCWLTGCTVSTLPTCRNSFDIYPPYKSHRLTYEPPTWPLARGHQSHSVYHIESALLRGTWEVVSQILFHNYKTCILILSYANDAHVYSLVSQFCSTLCPTSPTQKVMPSPIAGLMLWCQM